MHFSKKQGKEGQGRSDFPYFAIRYEQKKSENADSLVPHGKSGFEEVCHTKRGKRGKFPQTFFEAKKWHEAACLQNETAPEKLLNRYEKRFEKREKLQKGSEKRSETRPKSF